MLNGRLYKLNQRQRFWRSFITLFLKNTRLLSSGPFPSQEMPSTCVMQVTKQLDATSDISKILANIAIRAANNHKDLNIIRLNLELNCFRKKFMINSFLLLHYISIYVFILNTIIASSQSISKFVCTLKQLTYQFRFFNVISTSYLNASLNSI